MEVECQGHDFVLQATVYTSQPSIGDSTETGTFVAQRLAGALLATVPTDERQRQSHPQKFMKILTRKQLWNKFHHINWNKNGIICV